MTTTTTTTTTSLCLSVSLFTSHVQLLLNKTFMATNSLSCVDMSLTPLTHPSIS